MKVMQCWDDGVHTDEPLAKLLRKYKAKATFNINPGLNPKNARVKGWTLNDGFSVIRLSQSEMKDVYQDFKIAGHSMTHPHLEKLPPAKLKEELTKCKAFIQEFFGQASCGFAYPFGTYNEKVKQAVREAGYLYARVVKNIDGAIPLDDPMELSPHCHFQSPDFWAKYEKVRELDGIFYFWGHSYELRDSRELWDEFEAKLARISADAQAEWIDILSLFS